jgi:hypothetical protein
MSTTTALVALRLVSSMDTMRATQEPEDPVQTMLGRVPAAQIQNTSNIIVKALSLLTPIQGRLPIITNTIRTLTECKRAKHGGRLTCPREPEKELLSKVSKWQKKKICEIRLA